jgi:hypothetical protein
MDKIVRQNRAILLIAPEFDEEAVVHCLCQMRQRGTAVWFSRRTIKGSNNAKIENWGAFAWTATIENGALDSVSRRVATGGSYTHQIALVSLFP